MGFSLKSEKNTRRIRLSFARRGFTLASIRWTAFRIIGRLIADFARLILMLRMKRKMIPRELAKRSKLEPKSGSRDLLKLL